MKDSKKILLALGTGLALGGLLGVLFAPRKGKDTRKKISDTGNEIADAVKDKINKAKESIAGLKDEVENIICIAKDRA